MSKVNTTPAMADMEEIPIQKIVEFLPYSTIVQLVHQATKAERQVKKEAVHERAKAYYASRSGPNASSSPRAPSDYLNQPNSINTQTTKCQSCSIKHVLQSIYKYQRHHLLQMWN